MSDMYQWHPSHDVPSFEYALTILNTLTCKLNKITHSASNDNFEKLFDVSIYNVFDPLNFIRQYYWVSINNVSDWWPTPNEIDILHDYGWVINVEFLSAL